MNKINNTVRITHTVQLCRLKKDACNLFWCTLVRLPDVRMYSSLILLDLLRRDVPLDSYILNRETEQ